jgi:hypothetical protein
LNELALPKMNNDRLNYESAGHCVSSPEGIRTLVAGLRSQSPRPLDDGALVLQNDCLRLSLLHLYCAGVPGLEPRLTEPESAGLPITPYPKDHQI